MSFSSKVKNEIARCEVDKCCCELAELAAIVRMNATISLKGLNKLSLKMTTENAATARRIFSLLKDRYDEDIDVVVKRSKQLKKKNIYLIIISNEELAKKILIDIGFISKDTLDILNPEYRVDKKIIKNRCCKRAYIRGSFLGGGSISNPEKSYHLEFTTNNKEHSDNLCEIINSFNLSAKVVQRKENYVVYLKEGSQIVDLLNIIGAHQALLNFENVRVLKDMRNNVNRLVNCETANLSKTIDASMKQVENIKLIQDTKGLHTLPPKLREIAYLRLEYRDATLKEIGEMLDPPVSKSGVNHRFRNIEKIANNIKGV